jgi:hypothetical protein
LTSILLFYIITLLNINEQHVFNSSVVFWGIGYPDFQKKAEKLTGKEIKKDTIKVFEKDFENNLDYYHRSYNPADELISGIFRGYTFKQSMIEENRRYADIEIDKAWAKKINFKKALLINITE